MSRRPKTIVSYNMSKIKAKGSKIEKIMLAEIRKAGLKGYRLHAKEVFGKPDFSWEKYKLALFCDSAFWHGYKWGTVFKDAFKVRKKFWINKIKSNIERDKKVNRNLKKRGWTVLRFWDFEIKKNITKCIRKLLKHIKK